MRLQAEPRGTEAIERHPGPGTAPGSLSRPAVDGYGGAGLANAYIRDASAPVVWT